MRKAFIIAGLLAAAYFANVGISTVSAFSKIHAAHNARLAQ